MGFSSILFVFCFFALSLLLQLVFKTPKTRNMIMLVFSLVFYIWSGPAYVFLLIGATLVVWFFGLLIGSCQDEKKRKLFFAGALVLVLGLVFVFRYRGFFGGITQAVFGVPKEVRKIIAPMGIAYYSLQMISYLVDVYRGEVRAQPKIWLLLTYTSLFHLSLGGPVVRYQEIRKDLLRRRTARSLLDSGISRFSIGLAKVTILGQALSDLSGILLPEDPALMALQPALALWLGLGTYGLGLFFRIAGIADMAIGMGRMCGLRYPEQFDDPFTASGIADFWSRWQMSVVSFFADYVHNPLGDDEKSPWKDILATLGVWVLLGLWMGPSLNCVLWAGYFALLLILERHVLGNLLEKLPEFLRRILTLVAIWCSFILLRYNDVAVIPQLLKSLVGFGDGGLASMTIVMVVLNNLPILIFGVAAAAAVGKWLRNLVRTHAEDNTLCMVLDSLWEALHPVILLVLSAMAMAGNTANPFLFIQF